ncbi:hypothetical protein K438DRAFT_1764815 [Mycena galopus ATCC 62051]|nr:hypothetical protein K438DRAFT_1764815 [Mycena galopus ATCC 62051]
MSGDDKSEDEYGADGVSRGDELEDARGTHWDGDKAGCPSCVPTNFSVVKGDTKRGYKFKPQHKHDWRKRRPGCTQAPDKRGNLEPRKSSIGMFPLLSPSTGAAGGLKRKTFNGGGSAAGESQAPCGLPPPWGSMATATLRTHRIWEVTGTPTPYTESAKYKRPPPPLVTVRRHEQQHHHLLNAEFRVVSAAWDLVVVQWGAGNGERREPDDVCHNTSYIRRWARWCGRMWDVDADACHEPGFDPALYDSMRTS